MKNILTLILAFSYSFIFGQVCPSNFSEPKVLVAGDSWAQFMWDDGTYNEIFDKFGLADRVMVSRSLGSNPGSGHNGPEYAISGSTAAEWADRINYPWIDNVISEVTNNPTIETVVLSIGGNDILAGKSGGGWYQNMDADIPGSEAALFNKIMADITVVINAIQAIHPNTEFLISSYDYPNLNTGFFCELFACGLRRNLSFDSSDPVSDVEINQMMLSIEDFRINNLPNENVFYDNSIGLGHYYYGDGVSSPGTLPFPSGVTFGGNPEQPTLRSNFRSGIDPIHLNTAAYEYKMMNQTTSYFLPKVRKKVTTTIFSSGGAQDGWTTGATIGNTEVRVGDVNSGESYKGILSFDTSSLPNTALIDGVSLYIIRNGANSSNPFESGALGEAQIAIKTGTFGTVNVENSDFSEAATVLNAGCFHGTVTANDYALRIDLNASGLAAINKTGITQFRISFPETNANADYVDFNTGDAVLDNDITTVSIADYMSTAKPFLDIEYSGILSTPTINISNIKLYPNPVNTEFKISGLDGENYKLQIISVQGQIIKEYDDYKPKEKVAITSLANGFYFIKITNSNSVIKTVKILKTNSTN